MVSLRLFGAACRGDLAGVEKELRRHYPDRAAGANIHENTKRRARTRRVGSVIWRSSERCWIRERIRKSETAEVEPRCTMRLGKGIWKLRENWFAMEPIFLHRPRMEALPLTFRQATPTTPLSPNVCSSTIEKRSLRARSVELSSHFSKRATIATTMWCSRLGDESVWSICLAL